MLKKWALYFHTIRYLKISQLFWQCVRKIYYPTVSMQTPCVQWNAVCSEWKKPVLRKDQFFENNNVLFLNEPCHCDAIWAESQKKSKLWQYHLHYFYGMLSADRETRLRMHDLLTSWVMHIKPFQMIAWDPYPISLRVNNLIKYQLTYGDLSESMLRSMYLQVRYLAVMPEYHLLGNHLLENARTLVFAGVFFQGVEAQKWFKLGMRILHREIPEQILSDGGYFELSPMYHALILELMLDLCNLFQAYQVFFPEAWMQRLQKMRIWLQAMTHPDGEIAFFNDAALGMAPTQSQLENYAVELGLPVLPEIKDTIIYFKDSGYLRLQKNKKVLLLDCAKVGPDYQPGHAHADTLSFELSIDGQRCIVNSGTNTYEIGKNRAWQRSTAAHSTVEIDQKNSSMIWSAFRVAKRAYPGTVQIKKNKQEWCVTGSHNGYRALGVVHTRQWVLTESECIVSDYCSEPCHAISRYYLHPAVSVERDNNKIILKVKNHQMTIVSDHVMNVNCSQYYPEFGKMIPSQVIESSFSVNTQFHLRVD